MGKIAKEPNFLRKNLSLNLKKYRKIQGLTQERLAEATNLSFQTINDIEGCRMWVSDKTIIKLAEVLQIDAYRLFTPVDIETKTAKNKKNNTLLDVESKIIKFIQQQFDDIMEKTKK